MGSPYNAEETLSIRALGKAQAIDGMRIALSTTGMQAATATKHSLPTFVVIVHVLPFRKGIVDFRNSRP